MLLVFILAVSDGDWAYAADRIASIFIGIAVWGFFYVGLVAFIRRLGKREQ